LQLLQGAIFTNCPKTEREIVFTSPEPWHTGQVFVELPASAPDPEQESHLTNFLIFTFLVTPEAISSSVSLRFIFKSEPGVPADLLCPRDLCPPPKKSSNIEEPLKISEK
jgi:hypothetical protein